jgi:hypothetical protein
MLQVKTPFGADVLGSETGESFVISGVTVVIAIAL